VIIGSVLGIAPQELEGEIGGAQVRQILIGGW
jgi:hypothetical protein